MNILLSRARCLAVAGFWSLLCVLAPALTGCGGGGNSANGRTAPTDGSVANLSVGPATISGYVAVGVPVLAARVSVVDALGVDQGAAVTAITDGRYQLTLSTDSRTLPLFIQAVGTDIAGAPVVVHTVVQSLLTGAGTTNTVHLTPLTNAVVSLLLGDDPTAYFQNPTGYAAWSRLGNRLAFAAAKAFVAGVIRSNLQDAQFSDPDVVDFFGSTSFRPDKTGLDAVLESVRFSFGRTLTNHPVLNVSNRLALGGTTEVSIDLTLAKADLTASIPSVDTDVIVSSLLTTTGTTSIMPSVGQLEELTQTINMGMALRLTPLDLAVQPIFSYSYQHFDGRTPLDTAILLSGYGTSGYQLSNFQVLGCLDDPLPAGGGCLKIAVAALVRKSDTRAVVGVFRDAVTYTPTERWRLIGNGRQTPWYLYPVTWAEFDATGALDTGVSVNPGQGMQVLVSAREFMQATIQTPNNHALPFYHCNTAAWSYLCLSSTETGDLIDDFVLRSTRSDWVGSIDARPRARYRIQTVTLGNGNEINSTLVTAELPSADTTDFPLLDGLSASAPLTIASFSSTVTVSWSQWAAAHPRLRVVEVQRVIRSASGLPVKQVVPVLPLKGPQATLPVTYVGNDGDPATIPADATTYVLWLIAQDEQGRRYVSKITAQP